MAAKVSGQIYRPAAAIKTCLVEVPARGRGDTIERLGFAFAPNHRPVGVARKQHTACDLIMGRHGRERENGAKKVR